jgi:hypothetical protein
LGLEHNIEQSRFFKHLSARAAVCNLVLDLFVRLESLPAK